MSEHEKQICQALVKALEAIPEEKKEYFLGFAEGVEAAISSGAEKAPSKGAEKRVQPGA